MVQTEIAQLATESAEWHQALRNYRDELQQSRKELEKACQWQLSKDQLHEVEHLNNQFHIQLINIHDLKQSIKNHERSIQSEQHQKENISEELLARHEDLFDQYNNLENTLQELRSEFRQFISSLH
ncbi:MAG: hypothetical protein M3342_16985 [Bacteroidota bacterium]|nr:hypothetical protein [Flavisolibacter sp.]MDQ3845684.1 hypothetical protein [Bacteroidota bacterium]MBD0288231.1 hypothetical protein [Flavisolibacter sp.]MBD0352759.1 hypothetical protein [Flavisolibacter sp.]MBD0368933.1 hypothetical protein [Flavisolibacter sp.]